MRWPEGFLAVDWGEVVATGRVDGEAAVLAGARHLAELLQ